MISLVKSNPEFSNLEEVAKSALLLSSILLLSCEEKDYYRIVSVGQLSFYEGLSAIIVFSFYSSVFLFVAAAVISLQLFLFRERHIL